MSTNQENGSLRYNDHSVPSRRPNLVLINKKKRTCLHIDFTVAVREKIEKEDKQLDVARKMKHGDSDTKCFWNPQNGYESIVRIG